MSVIIIHHAVSNQLIDSWNEAIQTIPAAKGMYNDEEHNIGSNQNIRVCEIRTVNIQQRKLYQDIFNNLFPYVEYYQPELGVDIYRKLEIQHITYNEGGHYIKHTDVNFNIKNPTQRKISMMLMLSNNSEYGGGELTVGKQSLKEGKGTLIMFRPTIIHAVEKITSGVRKSLVMWAHGPEWR